MRIGIDFDNTIVSYDSLFHHVASEAGLVPPDFPPTKLNVRDYLRKAGKENEWIELQGYVYGARMSEATAFHGVHDFFKWARDNSIVVSIISHKTKYPFIGQKYDLHKATRDWIDTYLVDQEGELIEHDLVYLETTKEEKLKRIGSVECDYFIDDLPEILLSEQFPIATKRILFDPDQRHSDDKNITVIRNWNDLQRYFEVRC